MQNCRDLKTSAKYAAFIAPWSVVPIVALALKGGEHLSRAELFLSGLFVGTLFGVPLAYLAMLLVGYPVFRLLLAYDSLNAWTLMSVGAIVGALCGLAFVGRDAMALCGTCGFVVAFTAWLVIRRELARYRSGGQDASPVA